VAVEVVLALERGRAELARVTPRDVVVAVARREVLAKKLLLDERLLAGRTLEKFWSLKKN
jgi:PIN domain nuclease of toxin-antitoxin system